MSNIKIEKKAIIPGIVLFGILLIFLISFIDNPIVLTFSLYLTFIINFIVVVFGILRSKYPISLNKINWYFILIFLVIIPFYQFTTGYAPRNLYLTNYEANYTNIMIFIWCIFFYISYNTTTFKAQKNKVKKTLEIPDSKFFYFSLLIFSVGCFLIAIYLIGFPNFFIRENAGYREDAFSIMIDFLIRSVPVLSLSIYLWALKKKVNIYPKLVMYLFSIILFFITFILNYPASLSRFLIGAVYLGLIISTFKFSFFKGKRFDIILIISILVIFPIMYLLKFYTVQEILMSKASINLNNFNSVDFDAFQMIGRTIRFVGEYGLQYGNQLKSVLFFFVPRAIVDLKGIPSGELVASIQNISFTNLSSPIVAEAYIDFGLIGVIIYAFVFGKIARYIDFKTYSLDKVDNKTFFIEIFFSFLIGFFVYIYRGALQPTFLRLMGFLLFLFILYFVYSLKRKFQNSNKY